MVGRTNVGGGSRLHAVIAVTYPEGSICTCTNGTKMLKAKDTSGYALFTVKAGTYTVECHTGDNSKSKSTSVTVADSDVGKSISVKLTYELTIFKAGSGFADGLTWTVSYDRMFTVTDDSICIDGNIGYGCINVTPVNVSSYSTMWVDAEVGNYGDPVNFGIGADLSDNEAMKSMPANQSRRTFSLDISSFTGEKTLFLDSDTGGGTVYNWWLE